MTQQVDLEYSRAVRKALVEWRQTFSESFREWIIETVKMLALVNSAGLAGIAAIFASDSAVKSILGRYPSAAMFAIGLAAAVVDMYANSQGHLARENEIVQRIQQFDRQELDCRKALEPVQRGKLAFTIASISGWVSALSFLAGVWPFIRGAAGQLGL